MPFRVVKRPRDAFRFGFADFERERASLSAFVGASPFPCELFERAQFACQFSIFDDIVLREGASDGVG